MGNIRVVTFQEPQVYRQLLKDGFVRTTAIGLSDVPAKYKRHINLDKFYLINDKDIINTNGNNQPLIDAIRSGSKVNLIVPFCAYRRHTYLGEMHYMSIKTIYNLSSHFMGALGYESRDIIELDIPEDCIHILNVQDDYEEIVLPELRMEWVVSVLQFKDRVTEKYNGESALLYSNYVYNEDTYRMCYSDDVVFNGHGKGDKVEYMLSPSLPEGVVKTAILRDYVQSNIFDILVRYCYCLRHDLQVTTVTAVNMRDILVEMPDILNPEVIKSFDHCAEVMVNLMGYTIYKTGTSYGQRMSGYKNHTTTSTNPLMQAAQAVSSYLDE